MLRICFLFAASSAFVFPAAKPSSSALQVAVVDPTAAAAVVGAIGVAAALQQSDSSSVDDKVEVESYFNGEVGFGRWNRIYSETEEVNSVQMDIRLGHAETIEKVLEWAPEKPQGKWCDVGCGVGSLSIPVAQRGAQVYASDISAAMVAETLERAEAASVKLECETNDMENVQGEYDSVSCIDVMIHYPTDKMKGLVDKLGQLSKDTIYVSFAPKTPQYSILKKIGSLFPGPSKATRAYLHAEKDVTQALQDAGFEIENKHLTARNFYFSLLLQAKKKQQTA